MLLRWNLKNAARGRDASRIMLLYVTGEPFAARKHVIAHLVKNGLFDILLLPVAPVGHCWYYFILSDCFECFYVRSAPVMSTTSG